MQLMKSSDVVDVKTFCEYCHQRLGTSGSSKDFAALRQQTNEFFERYARADWATLCRGIEWLRDHQVHPRKVTQVVGLLRLPLQDGALPEAFLPRYRSGRWVK